MKERVSILGAGSWGIANAELLAGNGARVTLWEFDPAELALLQTKREHPGKLPGVRIPDSVTLTGDLTEALNTCDILIMAVPAQIVGTVCRQLKTTATTPPDIIINLAKGIEEGTLRRISQVIDDEWPAASSDTIVTMSGPSHAEEVGRRLPTTVVVGGPEAACIRAQTLYSNERFRVYRTTDIIGVEFGGALKNIIAIGAGIARGLGFGDHTQGALITRGLVEINRLAGTLGADPETLAGLSGVGDLITTCISEHSRNQYVGYHIGRGKSLTDILDGMVMVAEGVTTCRSARALARKHGIDMPITEAVYAVLFDGVPPREAVTELMTRPLKEEVWQ